jgi:molecular chaperone HscB
MICWSCEKNAGEGPECRACGAVQPPDLRADYFQVLGADRVFDVDLAALERRYKDLTRVLHPDRFARADPRARRASLERTVQINQAWRTLKDPVRRAEYLLSLSGIDAREQGGMGAQRAVPQELLVEVLELREGLAEARAARDDEAVARLASLVRARRDEAMSSVALALAGGALQDAARALVSVRYHERFLEEVRAHEDDDPSEVSYGG